MQSYYQSVSSLAIAYSKHSSKLYLHNIWGHKSDCNFSSKDSLADKISLLEYKTCWAHGSVSSDMEQIVSLFLLYFYCHPTLRIKL